MLCSLGHTVITYTPRSHMDFGTLLCWGTNMVGNQQTNRPCVFHIIPTGGKNAVELLLIIAVWNEKIFRNQFGIF